MRPLNAGQTAALIGELLGTHGSVHAVAERVAARADGNPFFAEEIVHALAERGAIRGTRGSYVLDGDVADISVPATLQAAIAARIDRLSPAAKRALCTAAIIGSQFAPDLLTALGIEAALTELVTAELIDQVGFTPAAEFAAGDMIARAPATAVLVESLLIRGADGDLQEAQAAVDRLAAVPTEPGFVLHEIHLLRLRALLARARLDDAAYEDFRNRYRTMAEKLGFEGHIAMAQAMA